MCCSSRIQNFYQYTVINTVSFVTLLSLHEYNITGAKVFNMLRKLYEQTLSRCDVYNMNVGVIDISWVECITVISIVYMIENIYKERWTVWNYLWRKMSYFYHSYLKSERFWCSLFKASHTIWMKCVKHTYCMRN